MLLNSRPLRAFLRRDLVAFEIEQHRALRAEIIQSMGDGNQIMAFGLAGLGLLVGAGADADDRLLRFVLFVTLVPLLSGLICSLWFAAQERTARASHFLHGVEARISDLVGAGPLTTWEAWLRAPDPAGPRHFWSTEEAALAMFLLFAMSSLAYGIVGGDLDDQTVQKVVCVAGTMVVGAWLLLGLRRRFRIWKNWLSDDFSAQGTQRTPR